MNLPAATGAISISFNGLINNQAGIPRNVVNGYIGGQRL